MKIITLIITISFFLTSTVYAISLNEKANLRVPLMEDGKTRSKDALIAKIIDNLPILTDEWQALEQSKSLKTDPATASLFTNRGYGSMMEALSVAGKLPKDKLQQAQRIAGAYDFYLKADIKPLIDKLDTISDRWDALEKVKTLKTDPITAKLFNDWGYGSMMEVLSVAGKLPKDKLQQAQRLASAYDFYLREDIKFVIDNLDVITDEWDALEQSKSLKTDPATASLFTNRGYGSMMEVLSVAGKLSKEQLPQAKRLASAYDFYLREDIKFVIDSLEVITDEWDALEKVKTLKTDPITAKSLNDLGYSSMMSVLSVAGKLPKDKLQKSQIIGGATTYFLKRKEIITNLLVEVYQNLNNVDRDVLLRDLETWDHKSRPNLWKFNGIGIFMGLLLKSEHEKLFPYLEDIAKPIVEQKFLAKRTRKDYLIVTLSLTNYEEFVTLISQNTPLPASPENAIPNVLAREPAMAL